MPGRIHPPLRQESIKAAIGWGAARVVVQFVEVLEGWPGSSAASPRIGAFCGLPSFDRSHPQSEICTTTACGSICHDDKEWTKIVNRRSGPVRRYAMSRLIDSWRMDRTAWSVESLDGQGKDRQYWLTRDPAERLAAIELARQIHYGYDPSTARLQRVY